MQARLPLLVAAVALALAGCGTGADDAASTSPSATQATTSEATTDVAPSATPSTATNAPEATFPVTVTDSSGAELTLDDAPDAIVSLSPTATESLFGIGAGDQVVAVDQYSYYPEDAPVTDLDAFTPNVEAIADYGPDLVIAESSALAAELAELDIPLLVQSAPADFDGIYAQFEQLGEVTGQVDGASDLVARMQADIDKLVADVPDVAGQTYFHELDSTLYTVTGDTFIGEVYELFGLENIADAVADDAGGYPQLASEFVVDENPDWIFLADAAYGESSETVAARPGWNTVAAVSDDQVVALPEDVPSRWGPRLVDFTRAVADGLAAGE